MKQTLSITDEIIKDIRNKLPKDTMERKDFQRLIVNEYDIIKEKYPFYFEQDNNKITDPIILDFIKKLGYKDPSANEIKDSDEDAALETDY